jgi:hypothetical protein
MRIIYNKKINNSKKNKEIKILFKKNNLVKINLFKVKIIII